MAIIPGSTCVIKTSVKDMDITLIDNAIFSFSIGIDETPLVQKKYQADNSGAVKYLDGAFIVPCTQQDTLSFDGNKNILYEAQLNFKDKSVSKTIYTKIPIRKTVATEIITGNAPNINQDDNYYVMQTDTAQYLNVSTEQIEDYVSQANTFAENAKTSMENAKKSEEAAQNYSENAKWSSRMAATAANDAAVARTSVENKISVANTLQNKAIEAATTAQQAKDTVLNIEEQVSADKTIIEDAKGEVISAKNEILLAKNEVVTAKNDAITAKDVAVEQANSASLNKDKTDTNVTTTKQLAEQVGEDKTEVSEMVTESRAILEEQRKLINSMPPIYDDSELKSRMTAAEGEITTLKEDLGELNKISEKISSVSIIQKCGVADGYYWNFIVGGKETKEINENYIAVKIPVEGNKLIVYGEFQDWASRYVNNGAYTPVESTYISHNTQTSKVAEFYNIPTDAKYLCLSFYKGGLDTSIESINVVSGEFRQNLSYRKTDFVNSLDVYTKDEVDDKLDKLGEIHINKIYVATTGSDTEGNGTKEKPYATVLKANDVITDASEKNKYEIIVADGTYTDLQEKYKGQNGSDYQGVMAKSYVTYKSQSNNPEKCIFIWDGGVGYDIISNDTCTNKCFFHINSQTIDTVIKGFKFVGSNLRYCLHFESNCLTTPYIENCIFDWHGRDFSPKTGPVIGMGGCIFSHITFKDCKFLNSQNDAGIQWHDNTYPYDWVNARYEPEGLCPRGAVIECIDCLFDNLNIQMRSQNEDRPMPCCLILKNCGGLKNVYPTITAGGTKNYWKLFNQCSFIKNDLLTDATETTTYDEMTSIKTSTD